ncbi:hypothetical protein KASHIRA_01310 [Serratia phage vB_SmaM-Kashira]|nr:hypothetical protein [Acinetobacter phage ABPH49]URC22705.1 hypothetical protein KASHIRA_01310 [Serratia phage vB_SmaM-Kashira]
MIFENADEKIIELVEAEDSLRHHLAQYKGATMFYDGPWTIVDDPWSIQWLNEKEELCQVQIIAPPIEGEKLSMFVCTFDARTVLNLVLMKEEYISVEHELEKEKSENPDD